MTAVTFDTHAYIKELKSAGFTEEQAEVQAKTLSSIFKTNLDELATRRDLKELELTIKAELRRDIETAKAETIKWMFGVATGQAMFIIAILKLFPSR
ncbi:MAG: CCDC90 family protein [Magnetococcus sp. THC-1_WYH]